MDATTTESRTAQTLLQQTLEVKVGNKTYHAAPPSVATLVLASEVVARLPHITMDEQRITEETLAVAKDCRELGELGAILILGAKHINDLEVRCQTREKRHLWGLFKTRRTTGVTKTAKEWLAQELMEELSPRELQNAMARLIAQMQVGDFFALTTFLTEINLIRPTKVETEATASGR